MLCEGREGGTDGRKLQRSKERAAEKGEVLKNKKRGRKLRNKGKRDGVKEGNSESA